jgi:hypothetical protein
MLLWKQNEEKLGQIEREEDLPRESEGHVACVLTTASIGL